MTTIDQYSFGKMIINGKSYRKDVIIYPDESILCPWWRESGHKLSFADIQTLIKMQPEIIVVGTGSPGLMKPADNILEILQDQGIALLVLPTKKAVSAYNEQAQTKRAGGCFHLTC